jgi:ABC-type phosphate transport system substrate-binding protein
MFNNRTTRRLLIVVAVLALVTMACTCGSLTNLIPSGVTSGGGGGGNSSSTFDGGDGLSTVGGGSITVGGSQTSSLSSIFDANNWTFQGTAGQTVTIAVNGQGDCDPRVKLIDPSGNVIGEDDDSGGGYNALLTATLPSAGQYTIRVDVFTEGTYTVTLN